MTVSWCLQTPFQAEDSCIAITLTDDRVQKGRVTPIHFCTTLKQDILFSSCNLLDPVIYNIKKQLTFLDMDILEYILVTDKKELRGYQYHSYITSSSKIKWRNAVEFIALAFFYSSITNLTVLLLNPTERP